MPKFCPCHLCREFFILVVLFWGVLLFKNNEINSYLLKIAVCLLFALLTVFQVFAQGGWPRLTLLSEFAGIHVGPPCIPHALSLSLVIGRKARPVIAPSRRNLQPLPPCPKCSCFCKNPISAFVLYLFISPGGHLRTWRCFKASRL